jgi:hypothetical protein
MSLNRLANLSQQHPRMTGAALWVYDWIILPFIVLLMALGSRVAILLNAEGYTRATQAFAFDGASPASLASQQLPQSTVTYYEKTFLKNLKANLPWMRATTRAVLPANSGNKLELFMYQTLGANTVQQAEGTVGAGISISVLNNVSIIGNYADFITVSRVALQTAIDPVIDSLDTEMAYRLAQTLNLIVQKTADGAAAVDSSVNAHSKAYNVPLATTDITTNVQSLAGRDVKPMDSGYFTGIIHPFSVGDLINDQTNNGITDVLKRTAEGQEKLRELPSPDGDMVPVLEWGGVRFHQSTAVTQTLNYQGHGVIALRTYIIGRDGVISISLGPTEYSLTNPGDGDPNNLKMYVKRAAEPSASDPAGVIGGWVSYNTMFTASLPPDLVQRIRFIDAVPIVS